MWDDKNTLKLDCDDGQTAVSVYKNYLTVHLGWVNCIVYKLHLNEPVMKIVTRIFIEEDPMTQSPTVQKRHDLPWLVCLSGLSASL